MMKIVASSDIHGMSAWNDIIAKERPEQVISLGDYVSSHEGVSELDQVSNLLEIMR